LYQPAFPQLAEQAGQYLSEIRHYGDDLPGRPLAAADRPVLGVVRAVASQVPVHVGGNSVGDGDKLLLLSVGLIPHQQVQQADVHLV
jgi:hypothetical protein